MATMKEDYTYEELLSSVATVYARNWTSTRESLCYYGPQLGSVALAKRTSAETWTIQLWSIRDEPDLFGNQDDDYPEDFALHSLIAAVAIAENPEPHHVDIVTVEHPDSEYPPLPANLIFMELRAAVIRICNAYAVRSLIARVPEFVFYGSSGPAPCKVYSTLYNHYCTFRYSGGFAELTVEAGEPNLRNENNLPQWYASMELDRTVENLYDALTIAEFEYLFCSLVPQLERAKFRYTFTNQTHPEGTSTTVLEADGSEYTWQQNVYQGDGHTVEEARLDAYNAAQEFVQQAIRPQVNPIELEDLVTVMTDERLFDPKPPFVVLSVPDKP